MLDSIDVLGLLDLVYTIYAIVIILLFVWFGFRLTHGESQRLIRPGVFYTYIAILVFCGVSIHILTFNTLPWVPHDLKKDNMQVDQTIHVVMEDHKIYLPSERVKIQCNDLVRFDAVSKDLTYGFGLVRGDESLVFQIQVVPGSKNTLVWKFAKNGIYSVRSTEYSGPKGAYMGVPRSIEVVGCDVNDESAS